MEVMERALVCFLSLLLLIFGRVEAPMFVSSELSFGVSGDLIAAGVSDVARLFIRDKVFDGRGRERVKIG